MRLHTLRLRAVGPFADEQEIDFDRLGAGGLFLFEGPTGVGKSTILDALSFALYGGLASEAGDAARLRSDFAPDDARPEVSLEFSVHGVRHRIARSPEFVRPKKRGDGVTRERASVHLERREADRWVSRSHAKDEVGVMIGELVGLNREQFRQVVLLPQGEFATFLRSDDDHRRELLVKLFGTHFFRGLADHLQARAQEVGRALHAADALLVERVAAACEAAGFTPEEHAQLGGLPRADRLERLEQVAVELGSAAAQAADMARDALASEAAARVALAESEVVVGRIDQLDHVRQALAEAEARRPEHEQRRARLESGRRAAPVRPLLELVEASRVQLDRCRLALREHASAHRRPEHEDGRGWELLAGAAGRLRSEADGLAHLVEAERRLGDDRVRHDRLRADLRDLVGQDAAARERLASLPEELQAVDTEVAAARGAIAGMPALEAALEAREGQLRAAVRSEEVATSLPALLEARRAARRALHEASDHHDLLVEHRLGDLRSQLAARLVSGEACLVCGSPDHPAPASAAPAAQVQQDIEAAALARHEARMACDAAEAAVVRAEVEREHLAEVLGSLTPDEARAQVEGLQAEVVLARGARASLRSLEERRSELAAELEALSGVQLRLAEGVASATMEADLLARDMDQRSALVQQARDGSPTVAARVHDLVAGAQQLGDLAAAVQEVGRALVSHAQACERAGAEARAAGFPGLDDARPAVVEPAELDQLAQDVAQWEASVAAARAQLESEELRSVAAMDPQVAREQRSRARARLESAEEHAAAAARHQAVAVRQRDRFSERVAEVGRAAARREEVEREGADVVALDQYARGMAGTPRMTLVTFVLRYWFEQVVAAANLRLGVMSAGKYHLIRTDEGGRRDARVGLGLTVLDRHTGRERSPGTLSGGETFYTSLALALGLADVVTAQAGGVQLDTLFIDEGFGSLDPDTLDDVMEVIDDLRGNGRVVGIVSHVPELKERIAERLSVRRARPDGPSTVSVVA